MTKKSTIIALAAVMFTASALSFSGVVYAKDAGASWKASQNNIKNYLKHAPGITGQVTSKSGNILTVLSKNNTTYTVDTTTAKIFKNRNTIITLEDIQINDTIMAQGTVTGTNVLASTIFDGKPIMGKKNKNNFPGIIGTVSDTNGSTFSVTTKNNIIYSVNTTNAKITKGTPAIPATFSDIINGDTVMIRGTVNGTTVTADNIFDGKITAHKNIKSVNNKHKDSKK